MTGKNDIYKRDNLVIAQARRQALLDILNATPFMGYHAIVAAMMALPKPFAANSIRGTIANMINRGEVASIGEKNNFTFVARVKKTISADEILADHKAKTAANNQRNYDIKYGNNNARRAALRAKREAEKKAEEKKVVQAHQVDLGQPRYTHQPGQKPNADSRGQGAVRERVYVNSFHLF